MYKDFFHLKKEPFSSSPDPGYLSLFPHTREALAGLEYGISFRKGITVLTGEVGTGKTLLLRTALEKFSSSGVHFAYVFNPRLDILDFLEFVLTDFGIQPQTRSKAAMLQQLNRWLLDQYRRQKTCVILVDEAQECSWELLEEIRLLTNLETSSQKLVQVVLSGQPELETKLRKENARQLRQRIACWCRTVPLAADEVGTYLEHRLAIAGRTDKLFTDAAIARLYTLSGGIPRLINLICEHALILAYVHQEPKIGGGLIDAVAHDLVVGEPEVTPGATLNRGAGLPTANADAHRTGHLPEGAEIQTQGKHKL